MIDRHLQDRSNLVRRAVVMLVVVTLFGCLVLAYGRGMFSNEVKVSALVDDAGGALTVGSDVKSRGVILGKVTSVTSADGRVRIGMRLDGDQASLVPRSVQARVIAATVFGTTSVDLVVPDDTSTSALGLPAGHVIQQDKSAKTLELQNTLDSTDRVLTAIEPAKLATTLVEHRRRRARPRHRAGRDAPDAGVLPPAARTTPAAAAGGPPPGCHQPASPCRRLAGAPRRDRQLPHHDAHGRGETQGARHLPQGRSPPRRHGRRRSCATRRSRSSPRWRTRRRRSTRSTTTGSGSPTGSVPS